MHSVDDHSGAPRRAHNERLPIRLHGSREHSGFAAVQEFVKATAGIDNMAALRASVGATCRELGFDFFAIVHHIRWRYAVPFWMPDVAYWSRIFT